MFDITQYLFRCHYVKKLEELKISLTPTPPIIYFLLTLFSQLSLI